MRTDRIYIARDGKSDMHVLVRILAVGDIGADYLPIDPDGFNELMMARDARSLVLAARGLGPMLASEGFSESTWALKPKVIKLIERHPECLMTSRKDAVNQSKEQQCSRVNTTAL